VKRYSTAWHDMSDYVVHFTRDYHGRSAYDNMLGILSAGMLRAGNAFGIARQRAPYASQRAVCFSEIPMHLVSRLAARRGEYGIGFTKVFLLERGGGPVWYVERDGRAAKALGRLMAFAQSGDPAVAASMWTITPFVDAPGDYANGTYRFEWEREWRHVGDLSFSVTDPAFLVIPERLHGAARVFFGNARAENTGPCYECPFLDPRWDRDRISATMDGEQS